MRDIAKKLYTPEVKTALRLVIVAVAGAIVEALLGLVAATGSVVP